MNDLMDFVGEFTVAPAHPEMPKMLFRGKLMTGAEIWKLAPQIVGPSFDQRRAAIATALHSQNVKDRNKYLNTKRKKLGTQLVDAYLAQLWPTQNASCQAVQEDDMDKLASAVNGWQSMADHRIEDLAFWQEQWEAWAKFDEESA